ncbi:hypothetical protein LINGRAHAP2_LOCUS13494 [Linum grandiflorum]
MADEVLSLSFLSTRPGDYPEVVEEDFYEQIEAPKYTDLTQPDPRRSGDDRYWFCLRVGCDQKHEEEMDSEAIYKNFVLRVMAARSPNVRLRKALCNRDKSSSNLRCPQTVPAKPSRPRMARLALISSISKKLVDNNTVKVKKPLVTKQNTTPNVKAKQPSSLGKALTTPRNRRPVYQDPAAFRSVRNPKAATTALGLPKKREVAKTLMFDSPKKQQARTRTPPNEMDGVKTLCGGMKKLEITDGKKQVMRSKKVPFRGREVKSRVYDGLHTPIKVCKQAGGSSKCLEEKNKVRTPSHMEIEEKCNNVPQRIDASNKKQIEAATREEKEVSLASNSSENQCEAAEGDDKENDSSVSDENRLVQHNDGHLEKNVHGNQDNLKGTKERGILKEANIEKKLQHPTPVKDNATRFPKANPQKGHHQKNETNGSQGEQQQEDSSLRTPKRRGIPTPNKHTVSSQKKAVSRRINNTPSSEAVAQKSKTALKKAKPSVAKANSAE